MLDSLCIKSFSQLEKIKFITNKLVNKSFLPTNRLKPLSNILIVDSGDLTSHKWGYVKDKSVISTADIHDIEKGNFTDYKPVLVPINGFIFVSNEIAFFLSDKDKLFLLAAIRLVENNCVLIVTNASYSNHPIVVEMNYYNYWVNNDIRFFTNRKYELHEFMISKVVLYNDLYAGEECVSDRNVGGVNVPINDIYYPIIEAANTKFDEENKKQNWFFMSQMI